MKKGFTLIEIVLVIAIMAIISTIAIPQISKYMDKANKSKVIGAISDLNNVSLSWSIENNGEGVSNISELLKEYGDISKLNINLNPDGSFEVGNIKGDIQILEDSLVIAKISSDSKAYPGDEIGR